MAQMIPAGIFTLMLFFVPETPRFLMKKNKPAQAHDVIAKIAGTKQADTEIAEIKNALNEEKGSFAELFKPGLRKALFIALGLSLLSELSGITVVIYFAPDIFSKAGFSFGQALNGTVIMGLINVIFTLFVLWKVDSMGRRPLAFIGLTGVFICAVATAILLYSGADNVYILIVLLCAFVAFFSFSLGPIKFIVMNEIFPTKIRGMAVSIATFTIWLANGSLILAFPPIRDFLGRNHEVYGVAGSFLLFAAFLFPGFFFIWKVMPETKGKSLEEIERSWLKK
jgi:MFS transporter, SP family, arabinose:H+ symporter